MFVQDGEVNGDLDSEDEEDEEEEDEDEGQGSRGQPLLRVVASHRVIWCLRFRRGFDGCQGREEEEGRGR